MFDLSNRDSFDNVDRWLEDLKSVAREDVVLILIGNKLDLAEKRQVTKEEATKYAEAHGMRYFEASSKTGENVTEAIDACVALIETRLKAVVPPPDQKEPVPVKREEGGDGGCC
jgi:GTPase SAR1 family protein